jgi:hypothetical protein
MQLIIRIIGMPQKTNGFIINVAKATKLQVFSWKNSERDKYDRTLFSVSTYSVGNQQLAIKCSEKGHCCIWIIYGIVHNSAVRNNHKKLFITEFLSVTQNLLATWVSVD